MPQDIKRVLYATDLSVNAVYAFGYAMDLATKYDAKIVILHVIDDTLENWQVMYAGIQNAQLEENLQKKIDYATEQINERLKRFIEKEMGDNPDAVQKDVTIAIGKGYPANEIIKKAEELHCDAIVMGTHGKGLVGQAFFGSVAKRVLRRVRKPVFIIPLPKAEMRKSASPA